MRSRKRKFEDTNDNHRWVVSYADFITLLFAFFVVMYAISSVNDSKYKSLSEGMHSAFNKKDQNKAFQSTDNKKDGPALRQTKGTYRDGLDDLNKSLNQIADGSYQVQRHEGWIEMDMKAGALFENGTAEIKPAAMIKLMAVAAKIKDYPYLIAVEGYTDNTPINSQEFPSNWELSAARAAVIGRVLNGYGIAANRILVTGYGDQFPIMDNVTEEGKSQNRRVNIIIAKDRSIGRIQNPEFSQVQGTMITRPKTLESTKQDKAKKDLQ